MIWQSTIIMTLFDLAVIAGGVFIALLIYRNREPLLVNRSASNLIVIAFGILIVAGFYGADLFAMWVLPSIVGRDESMAAMVFLHTNVSWFAIAAGFGFVTGGLTLSIRSNVRQIQSLKAEEKRVASLLSEIESSENRFRAFFDNSPAIMFAKDKNHIITFANAKYLEYHQVQETDVCGIRGGTTFGEERRAKVEAMDNKVMTEGLTAQVDMQIKSRHGDVRDFLVTKFPIYGAGDKVTGLGTINTDVTEQRQYEAKLIAAKTEAENLAAEAEAANRSKSEFLAMMSHELRTPMNGVLGMADLLSHSELDVSQRDYVTTIAESGKVLLELLNDVLDLSKIEAGRVEIESTDFSLADLLAAPQTLWSQSAADKGLVFSLHNRADAIEVVRTDPTRLRQTLNNLVSNAIKFTDAGEVTLNVDARPLPDDLMELRFEIRDTGIGITDEQKTRLFRPFSQADSSTTRRFGGTGLGLAICKSLVEHLGGRVGFDSAPGEGSTFWFTVPVERGCAENIVQAAPDVVAETDGKAADSRTLRILIAEDNEINQMVVTGLIGSLNCRYDIVETGAQAVAAVERDDYDIILMDIQMPEMNGLDATRIIRDMKGPKGRIPIVAMTANAMKGDREKYLQAGMDDYISKPLQRNGVLAVIMRNVSLPTLDVGEGSKLPVENPPASAIAAIREMAD